MMDFIRNSVKARVVNGGNFSPPVILYRKNHCRILSLLMLSLFMVPLAVFSAGEFDLHVNDIYTLDEPWPLVGGLPFPEGELHDASQIRIVDGEGNEVPAQIDVVTSWRDGSVRWALAGFNASPQGTYTVEFGPEVIRSELESPLKVEEYEDGILNIDTGPAIYQFHPDGLLPEHASLNGTAIMQNSGDGAYLIDNHGRMARVAGQEADITSELVKNGPGRTVVRREGWYVTAGGERVARARMWLYLPAGSPYVKVTHSLVLTEDNTELWVWDYGLTLVMPRIAEMFPKEIAFSPDGARAAFLHLQSPSFLAIILSPPGLRLLGTSKSLNSGFKQCFIKITRIARYVQPKSNAERP